MNNDHIFSQKEIRKILSKASEIQTQKDLYGDREGLTEQELVDLAKEVGIDKSSLLEALNTYNEPELEKPFNWFKGTSKIQKIAVVDGEISETQWEEVVHEIRKVNGGIGKINHTGSSFEWEQRMQEIGYKHISFTPQKGKTKIQYVSSWAPLKFMLLFFPIFIFGVITIIALKGIGIPKSTAVLFSPLGSLLGFSTGLMMLKSRFNTEKKKLDAIIGSVSRKIREAIKPQIVIDEDLYDSEINSIQGNPQKTN